MHALRLPIWDVPPLKLHFRALNKRFSRELNVVKFHGEELTKELFVEYLD